MAKISKKIKWTSPILLAQKISQNHDKNWAFLYSGLNDEIKNSVSIIAIFEKKQYNNLEKIRKILPKKSQKNYENALFGYVSYEYKNSLENFSKTKKSPISLPIIHFAEYKLILEFNHDKQILTAFYDSQKDLKKVLSYENIKTEITKIKTNSLKSNFSNQEYLDAIKEIKEKIAQGQIYQTNLTRKFYGKFNLQKHQQFFDLFKTLANSSPANFSTFLKIDKNYIISSSPELFLKIEDKKILSRPIKGTSARSKDKIQDQKNKNYLLESAKEKAENLMIVDLVRNDLSRVCEASSIKVNNLFQVNSYKTLHHLSSEISGKIQDNFDAIDSFKAAFPAGSMTGAPKIEAIKIASEFEKLDRGIYSGAIGFFTSLEDANFNVVIRTLVCKKNEFEFQVGGAITYDSDEKKELEETFIKAKAILNAINLSHE